MPKSNRLFASVIGLLLFIAVQFVIFIDYGVIVAHNAMPSPSGSNHNGHGSHVLMATVPSLSTDQASTLPVVPAERPMRRRQWKPYLKEKYADVLASTLRFELVSLFTPERAPDDEPHDPKYHMDNAPRRTAKIYRKWLEMQAEIKAHDEAIRLWKAARSEAEEDDDEEGEDNGDLIEEEDLESIE
jgi:hypothetical protein